MNFLLDKRENCANIFCSLVLRRFHCEVSFKLTITVKSRKFIFAILVYSSNFFELPIQMQTNITHDKTMRVLLYLHGFHNKVTFT